MSKEFRIILNLVTCKNTQLNKFKKTMHEQNEKFNKELENIKRNKS